MLSSTVGILSYNRPAFLREALISVLAQTRRPDRIAIYDNGSDWHVREGIVDLLAQGVEWVGAEVNRPALWNINRAMQSIQTDCFVLLHDDDRLGPDFIEKQIAAMSANLGWSAISCNGYFIDDSGQRTGATLSVPVLTPEYELFECSGQVALKYAGNSCIPFSPAMYRTAMAKVVPFRTDFGKVLDATYFCDLAEIGPIAYLSLPLYECRLHGGQDSSSFSIVLSNKLETFFETRHLLDESRRAELVRLLLRQHTARNLKMIFVCLKKVDLKMMGKLLVDEKFNVLDAARLIGQWTFRIISSDKRNRINRTVG
jgi:glycosyltransferase involved in cell wall biosynthesis